MTPAPITLASPDVPVSRGLLSAPGGFLWWYLDLLDARGRGLVVIWSFGLPFLPGYRAAARGGRPELPATRPSLNVAVYEDGAPAFYLLQEMAPDEVAWLSETSWRFGESAIERRGDALALSLSCPLPGGGRLRGRVEVEGTRYRPCAGGSGGTSRHTWTPLLAPARGQAALHLGDGRRFDVEGRAYHDRNGSELPLDGLGIDEWFWARCAYPGEERVLYTLRGPSGPMTLALTLGDDGEARLLRDVEVELDPAPRARFGMPRYGRVRARVGGQPFVDLRIGRPLDDGPFYLRSFLVDEASRETRGYCEGVMPARVDLDVHRRLVRMRVHHTRGDNSWFVPLLTGPRRGRLFRFARHLLGGAGA